MQRIFNCTNFYVNYISCNEEYHVELKNYDAKQINEIVEVWEACLKKN